ncbi:hypothetical protein XI06_24175 [Bradyrhizobium sp. CCBAU 11434]|uniref:hypothetical protein n=1 Tax=Bradyrhizobium sp. CCBAU 11434 TaxID=1630885 RepID=UPI0023056D0B|nr:hypothetical protein [Bradyrhizobium sp. CCBAU 11434]MDA9523299.1 hypothetical protein [Bradyrhizobium sp. CCBAU 11434]
MSSQHIDAIARDFNLSASAFQTMAQERTLLNSAASASRLLRLWNVLRDLQRVSGPCQTKVLCAANLEKQNHASPLKECPNEQTLRA